MVYFKDTVGENNTNYIKLPLIIIFKKNPLKLKFIFRKYPLSPNLTSLTPIVKQLGGGKVPFLDTFGGSFFPVGVFFGQKKKTFSFKIRFRRVLEGIFLTLYGRPWRKRHANKRAVYRLHKSSKRFSWTLFLKKKFRSFHCHKPHLDIGFSYRVVAIHNL